LSSLYCFAFATMRLMSLSTMLRVGYSWRSSLSYGTVLESAIAGGSEEALYLDSLDGDGQFDSAVVVGQFSLYCRVSAHVAW
jgi:hypothetical protein